MSKRIYVASSWRNQMQPEIVQLLRRRPARSKGRQMKDITDIAFRWERRDGVLHCEICGGAEKLLNVPTDEEGSTYGE